MTGMAELKDQIVEWIATMIEKSGARGAVVGLSGGLDSAVTAALCKNALDGSVLGVIMPCESQREDAEEALMISARLGIGAITVRLDKPFYALTDQLPDATHIAKVNLKPRLRMAALYYLANSLDYLVVGTGNKSEIMTGYFTKHGDGGTDILPLGALYKSEVRALARELNLPEKIISKPPAAGLWKDQTDEAELGLTYEDLDTALMAIETGNVEGIDPDILARVRSLIANSSHKRVMPPVFEVVR